MAIPELNTLSEKTRNLIDSVLAQNSARDWPWLVRRIKIRIREDLKATGGGSPDTYHPYMASLLNFYLGNSYKINPDSEELNELWRVLFYEEYKRDQIRRLEKEIDMSDVQTVSYGAVRDMFKDYGYIVCVEKTGTLRLQPWETTTDPNPTRYYVRASQAKAIFKVRMLDKWRIALEDAGKALEIVKEKNPYKADCLKVDLTNC